jgi:hypothetical protein
MLLFRSDAENAVGNAQPAMRKKVDSVLAVEKIAFSRCAAGRSAGKLHQTVRGVKEPCKLPALVVGKRVYVYRHLLSRHWRQLTSGRRHRKRRAR